jgi:hypothetical protein
VHSTENSKASFSSSRCGHFFEVDPAFRLTTIYTIDSDISAAVMTIFEKPQRFLYYDRNLDQAEKKKKTKRLNMVRLTSRAGFFAVQSRSFQTVFTPRVNVFGTQRDCNDQTHMQERSDNRTVEAPLLYDKDKPPRGIGGVDLTINTAVKKD